MRTRSDPALWLMDRGDGEPVLLITGWTISCAVFEPIAGDYTPHVRAVAYDHRGSGRSAPWPLPVSMAMLAADAARVLDDRGVDSAHVVGVSMGALVALELAVRMPHRLKSMVLIGGGTGGPTTRVTGLAGLARAGAALTSDSLRERTLWPASLLFSERFRHDEPERVRALVAPFVAHRAPPWTWWSQTLATSCFSRRSSLGSVRAPTLVLHGSQDAMSPVANAAILAAEIPGARLVVAHGCGHAVPLERPGWSAELLLDWFAEHAGSVPPRAGAYERIAERVARPFALQAGALRNFSELGRGVFERL